MFAKILIAVLLLIVGFLVFVAMKPSDYTVTRSAVVPASPATAFGLVNDFHEWMKWSPWEALDPNMKRTFSGASAGNGAIYEWEGNAEVGKGRMEITASEPSSHVGIRLEFLDPFEVLSQTDFHFKPVDGGTEVVWSMSGHNGFLAKMFTAFTDMDAAIGPDFEKGLNQMAGAVKAMPTEEPDREPAGEAAPIQ